MVVADVSPIYQVRKLKVNIFSPQEFTTGLVKGVTPESLYYYYVNN